MKNRLKAIVLATGLTVTMLCGNAFAAEKTTEVATEAVTEAATEKAAAEAAATEAGTEAVTEAAADAAEEELTEAASEAAEAASEAGAEAAASDAAGGAYAAYYDSMKDSVNQTLAALSSLSDEQLTTYTESDNATEAAMAINWSSVKEELGTYVETTEQNVTEEGNTIIVDSVVKYDGVSDKTKVDVVYTYDVKANTAKLEWNINYPMSKLMEQAALNTLMGIGIVFCMLLFLSLIISQLHWIPDLLNKKENEKQAAIAAAPAQAPVAAAPAVEEDLTDDLELVAVISAAIAASENTSADGFVVRSIKKANRRKWQNA